MNKFAKILSEASEFTKVEILPDGTTVSRYASGLTIYSKDDKYHRIGSPAIIGAYGEEYWVNGKRHRVDGPAVKYINHPEEYWVNGKRFTKEEFYKHFGNE